MPLGVRHSGIAAAAGLNIDLQQAANASNPFQFLVVRVANELMTPGQCQGRVVVPPGELR